MDTATAYDLLLATPKPKFKVDFTQISTLPNEITFSRAGMAMQADATGALTWAPNNLVFPANNGNTNLGPGFTRTANYAIAPDGTTSAMRLQWSGTANSYLYLNSITNSVAVKYMASMVVSANSPSKIQIRAGRSDGGSLAGYEFDTSAISGTTTSSGSTSVSGGFENLGSGFYRIYVAGVFSGSTANFTAGASVVTNAAGDVNVWGMTLSQITYETTPRAGDQAITTTAAYYGPRFDNTLGTANAPLGLLIEEARTNVALWNRDLTNAAWTLGATMTRALNQIGIDGVANSASSITGGAVSATNTILQAITLTSSARFQSAYVKRLVGSGVVNMTLDGGTTWTAITVTSAYTRVTIPTQTLANPSVGFQVMTSADSIAVDFVQNENGTFATSPIFTTTAAVTRAVDTAILAGSALTALAGGIFSVVAEVGNVKGVATNYPRIMAVNGTTNSLLEAETNNSRLAAIFGGFFETTNAVNWDLNNRAAIGNSGNGRALVLAGGNVALSSSPSGSIASAQLGYGSSGTYLDGYIRRLAIWNKRLPDLTLQAKTVLGAPL